MKKHLVSIVGGYYPTPSPTGKCAEQYLSLVQDEYDTDVICIARLVNKDFQFNKKNIYPVSNWYVDFQNRLKVNKCWKIVHIVSKIPKHFLKHFRHPNNLHWYVKAAYRRLDEIHSKEPIDILFSVGAPMASHCAAFKFKQKHSNVRWVTYSVDSYAAQNNNRVKFCEFEKYILSQADHNLLSEEIYNNSGFIFDGCEDKFTTIRYLLPEIPERCSSKQYFDRSKLNLVYAGSFYRKIRNPQFLLDIFASIPDEYVLHLYCTSDCDAVIDNAVLESKGKIIRHVTVNPDEIMDIYSEADVLVSVGNSLPEFKPSKTFEYIATGKPILNIHYNGLKDEVLEQHPCVLQLCNEDDVTLAVNKVQQFCEDSRKKVIDRIDLKRIYKKYTAESIRDILTNTFEGDDVRNKSGE